MRLRDNDPAFLAYVDRWWAVLFGRLQRHLYQNGGPIAMVQVENEYGFCGENKSYLRHLIRLARTHLGEDIVLFTTDPPEIAAKGSIAGDAVYTVVDFGPGWFDPASAFAVQKQLNTPGKSPPFCSEFYTGWLSHWGERMANTSTEVLVEDTRVLLEFANGSGSLNFYMAHGGSNFGFSAGANLDGDKYLPHITSYDYDAPISEGGDYCQPGIGGPCKYHALRSLIAEHTGVEPPAPPPRPRVTCLGRVDLKDSALLLEALPELSSTEGIYADLPMTMEEYGQRYVHKGGVRCCGASFRQPLALVVNGSLLGGLPDNAAHPHFVLQPNWATQFAKPPPHHVPTLHPPGSQVGARPVPHTAATRRIVGRREGAECREPCP